VGRAELVAEVIHTVARREDSELRRYSGKGVLSMPELAFVHHVAKELSLRSSEIFGSPTIGWEMNKGIGAGLTDLVIDPRSPVAQKMAVEFKLGGKVDTWIEDIAKLSRLANAGYECLFCALAEVFVRDLQAHGRFKAVDDDARAERIVKSFEFFTTLTDYATQTCCVVGLWRVKATGESSDG
jgi:hypothetical protein